MKDVLPWIKVIALGLLKWPFKLLAPLAYPFIDKVNHPIWGVQDATDLSFKNIAITNGCHNMITKDMPEFDTFTNTEDETLEKLEGFQWRYRRSKDGKYVSFRMTWGKPDGSKGKDEFYVGWTMNEKDYMRLTFFQMRPLWFIPIPLAVLALILYPVVLGVMKLIEVI